MGKLFIIVYKSIFLMLAIIGGALTATTPNDFSFFSAFGLCLLVTNSIAFNCMPSREEMNEKR